MASTVVGTIEKRLETIVSVNEEIVTIRQEDPNSDDTDCIEIKYVDLDAFVELLRKAKIAIETTKRDLASDCKPGLWLGSTP